MGDVALSWAYSHYKEGSMAFLSAVATIPVGALGAIATFCMTNRGLFQVNNTANSSSTIPADLGSGRSGRWPRPGAAYRAAGVAAVAGAAWGVAVLLTVDRGQGWAEIPAAVLWGWALVALASCDVVEQRIPTPLVRQATAGVLLLMVLGGVVSGEWRFVVASAACSALAGTALLAGWRFGGAGFGDVRFAVLGGLGLGAATAGSVIVGLVAWAVVVGFQATVARARGGSVRSLIPLAPGMAAAFVVAVLLPR